MKNFGKKFLLTKNFGKNYLLPKNFGINFLLTKKFGKNVHKFFYIFWLHGLFVYMPMYVCLLVCICKYIWITCYYCVYLSVALQNSYYCNNNNNMSNNFPFLNAKRNLFYTFISFCPSRHMSVATFCCKYQKQWLKLN